MQIDLVLDHVRARMAAGETFDYEAILETNYRRWVNAGDMVVDVGAHTGRHLGPLAELIGIHGMAHAFEPIPSIFNQLQGNFTRPNIVLHNCALADFTGTSTFTFAQGTPQESGLRQRIFNVPDQARPTEIQVPVKRLDDFPFNMAEFSFMKIDTEGAELSGLKGSVDTIKKYRPIIAVEYGYPSYSAYGLDKYSLYEFADHIGYFMKDIFLNDLSDRSEWGVACDSVYWDFVMVPVERRDDPAVKPIQTP